MAWCGMVWHGLAWPGVVWRGLAWSGVVWRGVAHRVVLRERLHHRVAHQIAVGAVLDVVDRRRHAAHHALPQAAAVGGVDAPAAREHRLVDVLAAALPRHPLRRHLVVRHRVGVAEAEEVADLCDT